MVHPVHAIALLASVLASACGGAAGLRLTKLDASVQKPSNVAVYFTVDTDDDQPVPGLTAESFRIYEDGSLVSAFESKQTILNPEVAADHYTLLLVDMSGSVTESGDVPAVVDAASAFSERVGKYQKVAVYAFDGSKQTGVVLTKNRAEIAAAFEQAAARIEAMSRRYYLLGYCSPARAGVHEVTIEAVFEDKSGALTYEFDATGFRPDCDPTKPPRFNVRRPRR